MNLRAAARVGVRGLEGPRWRGATAVAWLAMVGACGHIGYSPNGPGGGGDASADGATDAAGPGLDSGADSSVPSPDGGGDACAPSADVCDGVDNDCDPATADGAGEPSLGEPCDGPDADACPEGVTACTGAVLVCDDLTGDSLEGPPSTPACSDGADNDCDTLADLADPDCGCVHPPVVADCAGGWCRIPAGCFVAGSAGTENCRGDNEDQATVTLTHDFEIGRTEVTQAEYEALMGSNPAGNDACGRDCPVERVDWHESAAYCNELSVEAGLTACYTCVPAGNNTSCGQSADFPGAAIYECPGYRLPTEAEWEYAARAGTTGATQAGEITDAGCRTEPALDAIAWYDSNADGTTHPVCALAANAWGLCDVLGNVAEFPHDEYVANRGTDPLTDPVFVPDRRVVPRGNSFFDWAGQIRLADRAYPSPPGQSFEYWGLRCARTLDP